MMKQLAQNTQRSRQTMGIVCDTAILPAKHQIVIAIAEEGVAFAEAVGKRNEKVAEIAKAKGKGGKEGRDKGKKREAVDVPVDEKLGKDGKDEEVPVPPPLPPPALGSFMAMMEALVKMDIGRANRDEIQAQLNLFNSEAEDEGLSLLEQQVRMCRLETATDTSTIRLVIGMRDVKARPAIMSAFRQLGHPCKAGCAPAGHMETEISAWIQALETTPEG